MIVGVVGTGKDAEMLFDYINITTSHSAELIDPKLINDQTQKKFDRFISAVNTIKYRNSTYNLIKNLQLFTYIHNSSFINHTVEIKEGTVIQPNTTIDFKTKIGKSCWICRGSNIGHDCVIEDNVFIGPGVNICGSVTIEEGTFIGAGCLIYDKIKIHKSIIRGGSIVDRTIPKHRNNFK